MVLDGRYRIESLIARGGMATVYRGSDTRLDRTVAIKVMHPSFATDPGFVARFEREARAAARLNSPYVVAVHDQGTDHGVTYLVMEYVPGHTVRDVLRVHGQIVPAQALSIIDPVLEALAAAHRAGYIHRDVKPENVLISEDGRVKVTDFGLARAIETSDSGKTHGLLLGTVAYLSPEQVDQDHTDARSDVYSAGILLFEMLTGAVPFSAAKPLQVAYRHVHEDVPLPSTVRPDLPVGLDEVVARATRRNPDQRYPDADAFLQAVRRLRTQLPPAGPWEPAPNDTLVVDRADAANPARPVAGLAAGAVAAQALAGSAAGSTPVSAAGTSRPAAGIAPSDPTMRDLPAVTVTAQAGPDDAGIGVAVTPDAPSVVDLTDRTQSDVFQPAPAGWPVETDTAAEHSGPPPAKTPSGKGGRRRRGRVALALVALACIVGLLAFLFGPLQRVDVPDVAGKTVKEATALMATANLKLDSAKKSYSETVDKGDIISTDPTAGASIRTGSTVHANISRGPERYDVPKLTGTTLAEAALALKAVKQVVGKTDEAYHDTIPAGDVISTSPAAGTSVKPETTVDLTISKGPKPIDLPKTVGTNAEKAAKKLKDLGVKVTTTSEISETVPKGDVISMTPKAGTTVPSGSTVKLVASKGPPMVTVPNVVGKNRDEAIAALAAVGLKARVNYPLLFGTFDRVHSQDPKAGSSIPKGSTVVIDVV